MQKAITLAQAFVVQRNSKNKANIDALIAHLENAVKDLPMLDFSPYINRRPPNAKDDRAGEAGSGQSTCWMPAEEAK
jgi:hypothetical protein